MRYRAEEHDDRNGPIWGQASSDLNVTVLNWGPGRSVEVHVNPDLDVVIAVIAGAGTLTVDDIPYEMAVGDVFLIPKGASRGVTAGDSGLRYLTTHKRRAGLMPGAAKRKLPASQ